MTDNIIEFPNIEHYKGFMTVHRDSILRYENIKDCKVIDFKDSNGNEAILVRVELNKPYLSFVAVNEAEAYEMVKDYKKIIMSRIKKSC